MDEAPRLVRLRHPFALAACMFKMHCTRAMRSNWLASTPHMDEPQTTSTSAAAPPPQAPPVAATGLSLQFSDDNRTLLATYTPPSDAGTPPAPLTDLLVQEQLRHMSLDGLVADDAAIHKLVAAAATTKSPIVVPLGERRDGRCMVKVSRDRMSATLSLTPPQGGNALTLEQVRAALTEKGVSAGIWEDALAAAVTAGQADELEVAVGKKAVPGTHTQFEPLVAQTSDRHPHVDEHDMTDFRDLGDLVVVKAGTPLMRRIPPTAGEPGFDVAGTVITPKPGTSWPFAPGLKGVEFDPADHDLLLASVTGQPVMVSRGVKVDPNMVLPQVDISTGNVKFDGVVNVKGDVRDGMKITTTGDVFVGGSVEAAEIEAGGNVVIKGGVIGHSDYAGDSTANSWFSAKVHAKGSISARYAENANLEADVDVMLDDYAMHSEITALNHVVVGKPGSRKGRCMGGHTKAAIAIRVAESGSEAGMTTVLQAGFNPRMEEALATIAQSVAKHTAEMANLQKIVDFVLKHPEKDQGGLMSRALFTQDMHQGQMLELEAEAQALKAAMTLAENAHIAVDVTIHGGTEVRMGGKVWRTTENRVHGMFQINAEGELVVGG